MEHIYRTKGTCSREISFELDGDKVRNVHFVGGCDGNLKAVSKLVDGMERGADRGAAAGQHLRAAEHLLRRPAGGGGTAGL